MLADIRDRRSLDAGRDVVPADRGAGGVLAAVEAVTCLRGQVDATHEGDTIVDDDRLLVVTVKRPLPRVETAFDPGLLRELIAHLPDLAPGRAKERQRRTGPHEHAHVHTLGQFGQQVAQHHGALLAYEREVRREEPAGDVHMGPGGRQLRRHCRQRFGSVDQDLDRVALPRRRLSRRPANPIAIKRAFPTAATQSPPVVSADLIGNRAAQQALRREQRLLSAGRYAAPRRHVEPQIFQSRATLNE